MTSLFDSVILNMHNCMPLLFFLFYCCGCLGNASLILQVLVLRRTSERSVEVLFTALAGDAVVISKASSFNWLHQCAPDGKTATSHQNIFIIVAVVRSINFAEISLPLQEKLMAFQTRYNTGNKKKDVTNSQQNVKLVWTRCQWRKCCVTFRIMKYFQLRNKTWKRVFFSPMPVVCDLYPFPDEFLIHISILHWMRKFL